MEKSDFKEELAADIKADEKMKVACFKCGQKLYSEEADIQKLYQKEVENLQKLLKPLQEKNHKEWQTEYYKQFKLIKDKYIQTIKMGVVDQLVPDDICKIEVSVSFHLCPSCLGSLMEENGYKYCEQCKRFSKETGSICVFHGSRDEPPEYDEVCSDCADSHNDHDGKNGGDGDDD